MPFEAVAGDAAQLGVAGFDAERGFTFVQYGRQDGSGFPYALTTRIQVNGSPEVNRIILRDPTVPVEAAIASPNGLAEPAVSEGRLLYARALSDAGPWESEALFALDPRPDQQAHTTHRLDLVAMSRREAGDCYGLQEEARDLRLVFTPPSGKSRVLYNGAAPTGLACAESYRIARVYLEADGEDQARIAVLLIVRRLGFEGPDLRWMGVVAPLETGLPE